MTKNTDITTLMKQRDEIDVAIDNLIFNTGSNKLYVLTTDNKTHGYFKEDELMCAIAYLEVIAETHQFISIGLHVVNFDDIDRAMEVNKQQFPLCQSYKEWWNEA